MPLDMTRAAQHWATGQRYAISAAGMEETRQAMKLRNDPTLNHSSGGTLAGAPFKATP